MLRDRLTAISQSERISINYCVKDYEDDWQGLRGELTEEVLQQSIFPPSEDMLVLGCGPKERNDLVASLLENMGYKQSNIFLF